MPFFSAFADKLIDITSSFIVIAALHIPLLMGYLIAPPLIAISSPHPTVNAPITHANSEPATTTPSVSTEAAAPAGYFPLDTQTLFKEDPQEFGGSIGFKNPQTGDVVSFKITDGPQGQNGDFNVLLNGTNIGGTDGLAMTFEGYSPDNKYFIFETRGTCGAGCEEYEVQVMDIPEQKLTYIKTGNNFVSSYQWNNDVLYLTEYSYNLDTYKQPYRTTPKEIWSYSPQNGQYTLVRDLPETALGVVIPKTAMAGVVDTQKALSPAGNYVAVSQSDEQGDAAVYLQNVAGTLFTPAYCGFYDSWAPTNDRIKVFVPSECLTGNQEEYFYLYTDGSVGPVEDSTYIPKVQ